jgi:hypothetical protein
VEQHKVLHNIGIQMFDYAEDVCVFFTKIVAYDIKEIISTAKKFIEQVP